MATPIIRPATTADATEAAAFVTQLGYQAEPDAMCRRLKAILADRNRTLFVAESDGRAVGMAGVRLEITYEHDAPLASLDLMVVAPDQRARGLGGRLLARAEHWARERGAYLLRLNSGLHRNEAHAFYEHPRLCQDRLPPRQEALTPGIARGSEIPSGKAKGPALLAHRARHSGLVSSRGAVTLGVTAPACRGARPETCM